VALFVVTISRPLPVTLSDTGPGDTLIPRVLAGDMDALSILYRRHAADMLGVAYRLLGSRSDAEDVIQDLFVALPEALRDYREAGRFGGWLRQLTVRRSLMRLRAGKRRQEWSLEESIPAADPADGRTLREALSRLSGDDRTIVMLKAIEGYSHNEIADLLGIKRGTAEVRMHRAMERLKALVKEER
jgi:RNA polymerase sigma-70 factor (ECF subfamily)